MKTKTFTNEFELTKWLNKVAFAISNAIDIVQVNYSRLQVHYIINF